MAARVKSPVVAKNPGQVAPKGLRRAAGRAAGQGGGGSAASSRSRRRPLVLVMDDEQRLRPVLRSTLTGPELRVVEARDGWHALQLAGRLRPRVVLLDWAMPGLSGLELLTALRRHPETRDTAVVMLTACAGPGDRQQALAAGAAAYVVKPFSPVELCRLVERLL